MGLGTVIATKITAMGLVASATVLGDKLPRATKQESSGVNTYFNMHLFLEEQLDAAPESLAQIHGTGLHESQPRARCLVTPQSQLFVCCEQSGRIKTTPA